MPIFSFVAVDKSIAMNKGKRSKSIFVLIISWVILHYIMLENRQSKNTIKIVITVLVMVIFGEGVLGWGIYWPFLLVLLGWEGIYWLALVSGVLISILRGMSVGMPSLFILIVIGGLSFVVNARKEMSWVFVVISVVASVVFDLVFGFEVSVFEIIGVTVSSVLAISWFDRTEAIKIRYS